MKRTRIRCVMTLAALGLFGWSEAALAIPYHEEILLDNPAGYWRFEAGEPEGVAVDYSINARNGTYVGSVTPGFFPGAGVIGGFSGAFDGSTGFVQLPDSWGGAAELTVEAWVNTAAIKNDFQTIVGTPSGGVTHMQVAPFGNSVVYTDGGVAVLPPPAEGPTDTWRHIAITSKSGETRIFVNGTQIGSDPTVFSAITASSDVHIGNGHINTRFFGGLLDEVAIYNTALSPLRIAEHYSAGAGLNPPDPEPLKFTPADGYNISWNGNDGLHINGPVPTHRNVSLLPTSIAFGSGELGAPSHTIPNVKDGVYGNPNSWIAAPGDNPEYIGIDLGGAKAITSIAFGRSNSDDFRDPCGSACTDRSLGNYTLQYTTDAVVDANSVWTTIGDIKYIFSEDSVANAGFTPWLRHEYTLDQNGSPITATGLRIITSQPVLHPLAIDELEIYIPQYIGDANGDGIADFSDLGILLNNYNQPGTIEQGDFDGSGTVEFADLGILLNNYNQSTPAFSSITAVPEPGSLLLAGVGAIGLAAAYRRRPGQRS